MSDWLAVKGLSQRRHRRCWREEEGDQISGGRGDGPGQAKEKPPGRGSRLRGELIEATARLLEASGDAQVLTLAAVAREARIAAPSIYRHFSDRNELVEAVVADRFDRLAQTLADAMAHTFGPAEGCGPAAARTAGSALITLATTRSCSAPTLPSIPPGRATAPVSGSSGA